MEDQSSGTFTANGQEPLSSYQGNYRCYASNTLGTAMTHTVQLITEGEFQTHTSLHTHIHTHIHTQTHKLQSESLTQTHTHTHIHTHIRSRA